MAITPRVQMLTKHRDMSSGAFGALLPFLCSIEPNDRAFACESAFSRAASLRRESCRRPVSGSPRLPIAAGGLDNYLRAAVRLRACADGPLLDRHRAACA